MKYLSKNKIKGFIGAGILIAGITATYTNLLPLGGVGKAEAINAALSVTPQCSGSTSGFSINFTIPDASGGNTRSGRWLVAPQGSPSSTYDNGDLYSPGISATNVSLGSFGTYTPGSIYTIFLQSQFGTVWLQQNAVAPTCTPPTINTPTKQSFTSSGATLGGTVSSAGGGSWVGRGVCVGTSINPTTGCTSTGGTTGAFTVGVSGFNPNTTYNYRAYATNSIGTSYTTNDTFLTSPGAPTGVNATATSQTSINISWSAPSGGATSYNLLWCDRTTSSLCTPSAVIPGVTSTYSHNSSITCGRTYAYMVRSVNSSGSTDSSIATATTSACATIPTVTSPTSASITSTGATLGGNVTSNGGLTLSHRGVCYALTAVNSNPQVGGTGSTCTNQVTSATGIFTQSVSGLTPNSNYTYRAYANNAQGNGYSTTATFITSSIAPTSVTTNNASSIGSYKATLNGSANPNGSASYGYFRYYTAVTDCTVDSGGTRVPSSSTLDYSLGSGNSPVAFSFTTPSSVPLVPNTNYWYCAYSRNVAAGPSAPGTSVAAGYRTFLTVDGGVSACDAPSSGNLSISEPCTFPQSDNDGVDAGGNGTSNTGSITLLTGGNVTILPGQRIARGSFATNGGSFIIGNGNGGSTVRGGIWLKDSDNDNVIDSPIVKVVSSTQPAGYIRRNYAYTLPTYNSTTFGYASRFYNAATNAPSYLDCNSTNGFVYQNINTMVVDADNDGYKSAASGTTQCVGGTQTVGGRTYYRNTTGTYTWLSGGSALGGGATDCNDSSAAPCPPSTPFATSPSQTSITINWVSGTGPNPTTYNLFYCDRTSNSSCPPNSQLGGSLATTSYTQSTGISCGRTYAYMVRGINASGASADSPVLTTNTSSCASVPTLISPTVTSITSTGAILGGNITSNGGASITQRGICYSNTQPTPSLINGSTCLQEGGTSTGVFTLSTATLASSTTYYYRAYARNSAGDGYTSVGSFTTSAACTNGYIDGDGDGYGSGSFGCYTSPAVVASGGDCYDVSGGSRAVNTYPGAANYFSTVNGAGSFDYDCDGDTTSASERNLVSGSYSTQVTTLSTRTCTAGSAPGGMRGWVGSAPGCGATGTFRKCTVYSDSACGVFTTDPWTFTACTGSGSYIVIDRAWTGGALQCK